MPTDRAADFERATINLRELMPDDQILIWTEHSFYRFLVTDAIELRGQLSRDQFGESATEATLVGALDEGGASFEAAQNELRAGRRARFKIHFFGQAPRLTTSAIIKMAILRVAPSGLGEFDCRMWRAERTINSNDRDGASS